MIAPTYFRSMWGSSPEVWPCPSVSYAEAVLHGSVLDGLPWMVVVVFGWAAFGHRVDTRLTDWLAGSYLHVRICLRYQPHTPGRAFPNCSPAHNTVEQRYYVHGLLSHKWPVFKVILGVPADWTLCSAGHESEIHGRRRFGLAGGAPLSEEIIGPSSWACDAVTKDCV